jgi:hypothetical protein
MGNIRDVAAYLCANYPYKDELSKARLTKLVYLADWRAALDLGRTVTDIDWYFHNFGPYVEDVVNAARDDRSTFRVEPSWNAFGNSKAVVSLRRSDVEYPSLTKDDRTVLDTVIETTKRMTFNEFIEFVYDTYPVKTQPRYTTLRLRELARQYRSEKRPGQLGRFR